MWSVGVVGLHIDVQGAIELPTAQDEHPVKEPARTVLSYRSAKFLQASGVRILIDLADVQECDLVLDFGAADGSLTRARRASRRTSALHRWVRCEKGESLPVKVHRRGSLQRFRSCPCSVQNRHCLDFNQLALLAGSVVGRAGASRRSATSPPWTTDGSQRCGARNSGPSALSRW